MKCQESVQISQNDRLGPRRNAKIKISLILPKSLKKQKLIFTHSALFHMKTRVSLRNFVNDGLSKYVLLLTRPRPLQSYFL